MHAFLGLFGLLFALLFGAGGGGSDESGWTTYAPLSDRRANARAPHPGPRAPPPIVLASRAGRQMGVLLRYSIETDTGGYGAEAPPAHPARVTIVRPGEEVSISMRAGGPTQRLVVVRRLGCEQPALASVVLDAGTPRWRAPRRPGAYELEVTVPYFKPKRDATGSATWVLGLLVDATRTPAVVRASSELFVCSPGP